MSIAPQQSTPAIADALLVEPLGVVLSSFLAAFYPDPYEPIHLRAFKPKAAPKGFASAEKLIVTREGLEANQSLTDTLSKWNETRGIYFVVNAGGDTDANITRFNAFFNEADDVPIPEQHRRLDTAPLRPNIRVETKNSVHGYWLSAPGCTEADWCDIQARLIHHFGSDPKIKNSSRVMRLPRFDHLTYEEVDGALYRQSVELVDFAPQLRYTAEQMRAAFPAPPTPQARAHRPEIIKPTEPFGTWAQLRDELAARIMAHSTAKRNGQGNWDCRGICHDGKGETGLFYNPASGAIACNKGCSYGTILVSFSLPAFPLDQPHINFRAQTATQAPPPTTDQPSENDDKDEPAEDLRCTDMGNGYRFARRCRLAVRYSSISGKWYVFDGRRWAEGENGETQRLAKQTVKSIYAEAAQTQDEERRKALARWATTSENDSRLRAMLHQAESELPIKPDAFDADPMLFNCANGTIDLRTGQLLKHDRRDLLSKFSDVIYDVGAQAPRWLTFLRQIFNDDESLLGFLQKALGYSLTGDTSEQCFFLCHGTGANGKSVLLKTIMALMGDYGQQVQMGTLMIKQYQGVNNDVAMLRGARCCSAVETDADHRLAEATVKQLTGGDMVRARFLFHESFEFLPQFKIWLAANHKPQIKGNDEAIWRRIKLIPFNVTFPKAKQNPKLDAELREELPGILAWAVEGCIRWQREGLGEPEAVTKATAAYRDEMDALGDFLADCCVLGENYQATVTELYNRYESWCTAAGENKQPARWLRQQLLERGISPGRDSNKRFWRGIGLIRADEKD
jgi:P4 family phage/plasmid primase-like protien